MEIGRGTLKWMRRLRAAIPGGLLGMLVVVVAVERYVRFYDRVFCSSNGWEWRGSALAARQEAPACEILCFGDSLSKLGVLPRAIEARTGRRAYNLACSGSEPPCHYFLLRQALAAGSRPTAVVVNIHAPLMSTDPRRNVEMWPYLLSLRECAELAWEERDASFFASMALARFLPTVRFRFPLRKCIKDVFVRAPNMVFSHTFVATRLWRVNRGAAPTPGRRDNLPDIEDWGKHYVGTCAFSKINRTYISRFLQLAIERNIRVYWLIPPMEPALDAWCQRTGFASKERQFLRALQARFPNLVVIDARGTNYDPGVFWDRHHLEKEGAVAYSIDLGNVLRHDLARGSGGGKWIALPQYQAHVADFMIEDIAQAGLALGKGPTVR
ncbi:MAG TPA: hypothetical protein VGY53_12870 [Isosphaeraceae bacterium]|nr:hypothetical protein [Isosphaeraceae bacterium]